MAAACGSCNCHFPVLARYETSGHGGGGGGGVGVGGGDDDGDGEGILDNSICEETDIWRNTSPTKYEQDIFTTMEIHT